jgi:GAF domain-containing protein
MVDLSTLEAGLLQLTRLPVTGENTAELMQRAVAATQEMPSVDGCGLMLIDGEQALRYVAASDEPGRILESSQEQAGEGPCIDSLVRDEVVSTTDVVCDPRWPRLAPLIATAPVRAVLGVPTHLGGGAVGTLNVYANHPHDWEQSEISALGAFAHVVDSLLASSLAQQRGDELTEQLQYALDYRVVIERGVGYLMCHDGVDSVTAFVRLRTAARGSRRKVVDVARDLLDGQPLPAAPPPPRSRQPRAR